MSYYPEEIEMDGHPLWLMKEPAKIPYCCMGCEERDMRPCYKHEDEHYDYHLHKECYDSLSSKSIVFNLSSTHSKCVFIFKKEALGGKGVCDACGDDVKGWFYKCQTCKKPHYLHPCCAKLPNEKSADTGVGEIIIDLKVENPSECRLCGNKENPNGFRGWYYISRCGNYCYHWSCMKHLALKMWKNDDDQCDTNRRHKTGMSSQALKTTTPKIDTIQHPNYVNQKGGYETGTSSQAMQPSQDTTQRPRVEAMVYIADVAVDLLNIFIPLIFGLPPLPLGLVLKWLK